MKPKCKKCKNKKYVVPVGFIKNGVQEWKCMKCKGGNEEWKQNLKV